jgi:hypothetical protein
VAAMSFDYAGEGLIKCDVCSAMVPSFESIIDLPGAPEDGQPCFRPVMDATMHAPGCTYCHSPETMEYLNRFQEYFDREDQERNKLTVGELLDSISCILNLNITAKDLTKVAKIGELLFSEAICTADDQDNAEFFEEAYCAWGPVVNALLHECGRECRDPLTGRRRGEDPPWPLTVVSK